MTCPSLPTTTQKKGKREYFILLLARVRAFEMPPPALPLPTTTQRKAEKESILLYYFTGSNGSR